MIVSSYYNKEKETLVLATAAKEKDLEIFTNQDRTVIQNGNGEMLGVNIFNYKNDNLKSGLVNNQDIKDILKDYYTDVEAPFIVGEISAIEKHPKSEKLNVCQVNLRDYKTQIVCGAANVKEGIRVIVAKVGTTMPNGMKILPSELLGIASNGMICSLNELGKSEEVGVGIAILSDDYQIGQDYY